jgi:hypothetical protein
MQRLPPRDGRAGVSCFPGSRIAVGSRLRSRRIAVELYRKLVSLRPAWHAEDDDKQEKATETVLEQAEVLSEAWSSA